MIRIGVLGAENSPHVRDLIRASSDAAVVVACQEFLELAAATSEESAASFEPRGCDAILVRSMPLGSLEQVIFRMDCLQRLESVGIPVFNSPRSLEVAIDKWLTLHRLQLSGLPVPETIACQTREMALAAFERLGGDVVVKPIFGGEGRGIVRVRDKDMAWRVFSTLQQLRSVIYVQQFQPHFGYDVRVLIIGKRNFAIRRRATGDDWRTNLARGSVAEPHALTDEQLALAGNAARAIGGSVVGVDLLPCRDGQTRVLEVNAVPGWRGLGRALNVDVAEAILHYICNTVSESKCLSTQPTSPSRTSPCD